MQEKNLKLDYWWENPSLHYIYSAITSMSYPLWTQLAVSEQDCTLKNTLTFQIPPPFPAGTCIILTISSWLGEGYQEWQCGKSALAGRSVGTWSMKPEQALASQKHMWRWQLTSLCFLAGARSSISLQTDSGRAREQTLSLLLCKDMY